MITNRVKWQKISGDDDVTGKIKVNLRHRHKTEAVLAVH